MKRRNWLLAILCVRVLSAQLGGTANFVYLTPRTSPVDGNTWRAMSTEEHQVWLSGLRDGTTFGIAATLSTISPRGATVYDPFWVQRNEVDSQWPVTLSFAEAATAMDDFYQNPEYRQIFVASAMNIVCYRKLGASESQVRSRIKLILNLTKDARKNRGIK